MPLVEEEQPLPGSATEPPPGPLDVDVLQDGPDADEQAERHDEPPQPGVVLGRGGGHAVVGPHGGRELGATLDDEGPLGEGEAEAGEGAVSERKECLFFSCL